MIVQFINGKLQQALQKKKHEVIRLRWQKAEIEKNLEEMKKSQKA